MRHGIQYLNADQEIAGSIPLGRKLLPLSSYCFVSLVAVSHTVHTKVSVYVSLC